MARWHSPMNLIRSNLNTLHGWDADPAYRALTKNSVVLQNGRPIYNFPHIAELTSETFPPYLEEETAIFSL